MEEISRACASTGVIMSVQNSLVCDPIQKFGSDVQKEKFLRPLARGETIGAYCLTEPEAGSDAQNLRTTAVRDGDHYVVNGTKNFITNGQVADTYIVYCKTDPNAGHRGISALLIEGDREGLTRGHKENTMGIRASSTCSLFFTNVRVPAGNLLGQEGSGFKVALATLDGGRIGIASQALGIAQAALDAPSIPRSANLRTSDFRAPGHTVDARGFGDRWRPPALTYRAATKKEVESATAGKRPWPNSSLRGPRWWWPTARSRSTGYSCIKEYPVERYYRDAKITEIYEGTSEIQRMVIARNLLAAS
jgi:butyryl-CoA dehydrogenase